MKKTLVVLLALMMIFAFASIAQAADTQYVPYTDISDQDVEIQNAIEKLSILGALKGYDAAGTLFAPANSITREEFATIGVRIAGLEDQVGLYAALASAFSDVEDGRWSEGYINAASANGIMVGRGDGKFDPKSNVTMQEVATVLLRAVGYDDRLPGSWPTDYNNKAVASGLADYVDFVGPKYATRGDVASMTNEALGKFIVFYVENEFAQGYGMFNNDFKDGEGRVDEDSYAYRFFETNDDDEDYSDLLEQTFECTVEAEVLFEDSANAADYSEGTAWGFVDFEDWELEVFANIDIDEWDNVDGDGNSTVDFDAFELATLYGVGDGSDITDLGYQVADLTVNEDDEVVYIDLLSTVTRTAEADDDYADGWVSNTDDLAEEAYGEYWVYDFDTNGVDNQYAAKDFVVYAGENLGVVDDVDEYEVDFKYNTGAPFNASINYDDDDTAFYLMGEGFITADELMSDDVLFDADYVADGVDFFLVFRPEAGSLDDYGEDFITVDGVEYAANTDSCYSINLGDDVEDFDDTLVDEVELSDSIMWTDAYHFVTFAYFVDDLEIAKIAVIDSYEYDSIASHTRILDADADEVVVGMNVLLPGDDELTTVDFADELNVDDDTLPIEGSMIEYSVNSDGECVNWNAGSTLTIGHDWLALDGGDEPLYEELTCAGLHGANVVAEWNSAKTRLEIAMDQYEDGDEIPDDTDAVSDVYTFADDAKIFLVESNADLVDDDEYDFDSADSITLDEFKEMGDFIAYDLCIYDLSGSEISVLYIADIDEEGSKEYGIGIFEAGDTGYSVSAESDYAYIDGERVLVDANVRTALEAVADDEAAIFVYMTIGGVVEDNAGTDYVIIDDNAYAADINVYYGSPLYAELEYEISSGDVLSWDDGELDMENVVSYEGVDGTYGDETYFTETCINGYDFFEIDSIDFPTLGDNCDEAGFDGLAIVVYTDGDNELAYTLVWDNNL